MMAYQGSVSGSRGVVVAILAALVAVAGCGTKHRSEPAGPTDRALPVPVLLESVIDQEAAASRFKKLKRWLKVEDQTGGFLVRPYGVAWDESTLLITDPGSGRLWRVGAKRRPESSPREAFESPMGVAACPEGIAVTDSVTGRVVVLDRDLQPIETVAEGLERPTGVACADDRILVVETGRHRVVVYGRSGGGSDGTETGWEIVNAWGARGENEGEFNFPAAIATDSRSVWVGDTLNFRVQKLDVGTGRAVTVFGTLGDSPGEMPRIKGLAVDSVGQLWISDAHLDQVSIFGSDGRFLMFLGGTGSQAGEFVFPAGIAAHTDGRVAVADSLNRRVQVFRVVSPVEARGLS